MKLFLFGAGVLVLLSGCQPRSESAKLACAPDNDGLVLPEGFCAVVVADSVGRARHLAVRGNGDVYVALRQATDAGSIAALRDTTGDGTSDVISYFGEVGGTGIKLRDGHLYFASDTSIVRYALAADELVPRASPEAVVSGFPPQPSHAVKPFEFDGAGNMYVNIGAPSNACQAERRMPGSAGLDPCPLLDDYAGVWHFLADEPGQTRMGDGHRYATGIRNSVALSWHAQVGKLYVVQHGRDDLHRLWPDRFTAEQNDELPAEELLVLSDGADFGWPYCYFDGQAGRKVLSPEYGGNGQETGRCASAQDPVYAFPAHWAPNDLLFYGEGHFPARYHGGAFVAFHGSWNREAVQRGYNVVFLPMQGEQVTGDFEVFADGFAGRDTVATSSLADARPTGLAIGPDGSLYVSDSRRGRIWRIVYTG